MREQLPFLFAPDEAQKSVNNRSFRYTLARISPILLVTVPSCNPLPLLENGGAVGILVTIVGVSTYFMYNSHEKKEFEDYKRAVKDEIKRQKNS